MEIDLRYKIPLQGEYNAGINNCPECNFYPDTVMTEIIGFADSNIGIMTICECPVCFTKWYYHNGLDEGVSGYHYFKASLKYGRQKHYTP